MTRLGHYPLGFNLKINLVLDEEVRAYAAKGRRSGDLGSMNIGLQSMSVREKLSC